MLLKTQTLTKFLNTANNVLGKDPAQLANIKFSKGNLHVGLTSNKGQATLDIPAQGKENWEIGIPVSTFVTLCSKNKEIEIQVNERKADFKAGKTHKGTINTGDYSEIKIEKPKKKLPQSILEILPLVKLGINFNNEMIIARVRTEKNISKILTSDRFHFALTKSKGLGNFDIPVIYTNYYGSIFEKAPNFGLHENFFVAWDSNIRLRLPLIEPSSEEVPFELATDDKVLKNIKTKAFMKSSILKKKIENVCLTLQDNELIEFKPEKNGIRLSIKSKIGKSEDFLSCKIETNGKSIRLDPYYLEDMLALVDGDIEFHFVEKDGINRIGVLKNKKQTLYMMASND